VRFGCRLSAVAEAFFWLQTCGSLRQQRYLTTGLKIALVRPLASRKDAVFSILARKRATPLLRVAPCVKMGLIFILFWHNKPTDTLHALFHTTSQAFIFRHLEECSFAKKQKTKTIEAAFRLGFPV
jgi:hypothetical protein